MDSPRLLLAFPFDTAASSLLIRGSFSFCRALSSAILPVVQLLRGGILHVGTREALSRVRPLPPAGRVAKGLLFSILAILSHGKPLPYYHI